MNDIEKNINWFKKIFLGFLGSIALSKALYKFSDLFHLNDWNTLYINSIFQTLKWEEILYVMLWVLFLAYFIGNTIRYYMSSFIYDAHANKTFVTPNEILDKEFQSLNISDIESIKSKIISKLDKATNNISRIVALTIIDLITYSFSIFLFGLAGLSMCNANPISFFFIFLIIVIIDLLHILFQKRFYYNKYNQRQKNITRAMREVLDNEIKQLGDDVAKIEEVTQLRNIIDNHKNTDELKEIKNALKNWIIIDLIELIIWFIGIVISYYWNYNLIAMSFVIISISIMFIKDIQKNNISWSKLFGFTE